MDFVRLRLCGFKSFVEPTELVIEPGLTGIVGPNGCGKSNLIDGLRWVMGETSARQMRGREMDDVIFGGSAGRPPRNVAEISLSLENVPSHAAHAEAGEIALSRRIERNQGSTYHINGRDVRARDVHLLFADQATGARGTTLVSQGGIGEVIGAKPAQRRALLEEAAGITGLHSRRHEAELKLAAAATNMDRLTDVLTALDAQHQGFLRQVRQAVRYRNLGERIRRDTALLLYGRWRVACQARDNAETALAETVTIVDAKTRRVTEISTLRNKAAESLPAQREAETEAESEVHRLEMAIVSIESESRRINESRRELEAFSTQILGDLKRERRLADEAAESLTDIRTRRAEWAREQDKDESESEKLRNACDNAAGKIAELDQQISRLDAKLAAQGVERVALTRNVEEIEGRLRRFGERAAEIAEKQATLARKASTVDEPGVGIAASARARVEAAAHAKSAVGERSRRQAEETAALRALQEVESKCSGLRAEATALSTLLSSEQKSRKPIAADLTVEDGYESALSAALGDDLMASAEGEGEILWHDLGPLPDAALPLPKRATPLTDFVRGAKALERRLSQIGVVAAADGRRWQKLLVPGQRLVSRDGGLWRWDGFSVAPGSKTPAELRLRERNRLKSVENDLVSAESARHRCQAAYEAAQAALQQVSAAEALAREEMRTADDALHAARDAQAEAASAAARIAADRASLDEAAKRVAGDTAETEVQLTQARAALTALVPNVEGSDVRERLAAALADRRSRLQEQRDAYDRLGRSMADRREKIAANDAERRSCEDRVAGAKDRQSALAVRRDEINARLDEINQRPAHFQEERQRVEEKLIVARAARQRAAGIVSDGERGLREIDAELKVAEEALSLSREERVRCQGTLDQCQAARDEVSRAVDERLDTTPDALPELARLRDGESLPDAAVVEARLKRLVAERDGMGAVNLRAEDEAAKLGEELDVMRAERADLEDAISRLRSGIVSLNREGRERLLAAFDVINKHFGTLFTRLFRGGHAHLTLVDSDDPFEAGLEIMASPPGKRLQVLSLLSGGEQALTAIALTMAVFLTNPAPICVLDEVDAPLDDQNVARVCDLLEEITRGSATRFLVITHHPMTMARMQRLFGVTMVERGVSQLVSVDFKVAEDLRAAG